MPAGSGDGGSHTTRMQEIAGRIRAGSYEVDVEAVAEALAERLIAGRAVKIDRDR